MPVANKPNTTIKKVNAYDFEKLKAISNENIQCPQSLSNVVDKLFDKKVEQLLNEKTKDGYDCNSCIRSKHMVDANCIYYGM